MKRSAFSRPYRTIFTENLIKLLFDLLLADAESFCLFLSVFLGALCVLIGSKTDNRAQRRNYDIIFNLMVAANTFGILKTFCGLNYDKAAGGDSDSVGGKVIYFSFAFTSASRKNSSLI